MYIPVFLRRLWARRPWKIEVEYSIVLVFLNKNREAIGDPQVLTTFPKKITWPDNRMVVEVWIIWRRGKKRWGRVTWGESKQEWHRR